MVNLYLSSEISYLELATQGHIRNYGMITKGVMIFKLLIGYLGTGEKRVSKKSIMELCTTVMRD